MSPVGSIPEISIVTPSFGQLDWLQLAIASVQDQTGIELEHIIQDAGTAGIASLINARNDARLRLFSEKDSGMYDAINRGFKKARGQVCAYLNCDEQYLPGTLQHVCAFFSGNPKIDIVIGDTLIVDSRGDALSYRKAIVPRPTHIRLSHLDIFSCATFVRKRVLDAGHVFDPRWRSIGDAVWIYEMLRSGRTVAVLPQLLSTFTLTGQNLSLDDPVSRQEKTAWSRGLGMKRMLRPWSIVSHRLQKLLARAYRPRTIAYAIYTQASPDQRAQFHAEKVPGFWPRT